MYELALIIFCGYLLGSLNGSLILGKINNFDIRKQGSGNAGATNIFRMQGKAFGILVLCFDSLKGFLAMLLSDIFIVSQISDPLFISEVYLYCSGLSAFLGHCYPLWFRFKGGKGAATGLGVFIYLYPILVILSLMLWLLSLILFRYVGLSTMITFISFPLFLYLLPNNEISSNLQMFSIIFAVLILFTHQKNIRSMIKGTEPKIHFLSKKNEK